MASVLTSSPLEVTEATEASLVSVATVPTASQRKVTSSSAVAVVEVELAMWAAVA